MLRAVVAAPPRESVVTVVLKSVPVVVVLVISADVAPLTAKSPLMVVSSERVIDEVPESIVIFPVVEPPKVNVCMAVVDKVPVALRYAPPAVPAETEAVGVPEFTFKTANLAEPDAVLPIKRSKVSFAGDIAPELILQLEPLLDADQERVPDPFVVSAYVFDPSAEGNVYDTLFSLTLPSTSMLPSIYKSSSESTTLEAPDEESPMMLYAVSLPEPPILSTSASAKIISPTVELMVKSPDDEIVKEV